MKLLIAFTAAALLTGAAVSLDDWKLEKEEEGIRVYTRAVNWSKMREFKGEASMSTTLQKLVGVLRDPASYGRWMHNTTDCRQVRAVSENEFYTYFLNEAPWPVSDRDVVTRMQITYPSANTVLVQLTAAPDEVPRRDGVVRISQMSGYWQFTDIGNGKVLVVQQAHADPGGSVPAWLANTSIVDSPFNTLKGLRKWVQY